jgi:hypothetical protein
MCSLHIPSLPFCIDNHFRCLFLCMAAIPLWKSRQRTKGSLFKSVRKTQSGLKCSHFSRIDALVLIPDKSKIISSDQCAIVWPVQTGTPRGVATIPDADERGSCGIPSSQSRLDSVYISGYVLMQSVVCVWPRPSIMSLVSSSSIDYPTAGRLLFPTVWNTGPGIHGLCVAGGCVLHGVRACFVPLLRVCISLSECRCLCGRHHSGSSKSKVCIPTVLSWIWLPFVCL